MMDNVRLIARMDIKGPNLIKGVQLEGLRVVGDPKGFARRYYEAGVDELLYMDIVASLYGRNNLVDMVRETTADVFVPITVGGGVRNVEDARTLLRAGADKVAINTAATKNPDVISELANHFGTQCVVLSIEAKKQPDGHWEAYTDNGRERTGMDAVEWARTASEKGAGEILVTSVDREGTRKGFDIDLVQAVKSASNVPVVASGGMGQPQDLIDVVRNGGAEGVAMADILHFDRARLEDLRTFALDNELPVRTL